MRNGTLITVDDHPALRFERHFGHSAERVWRAVTEPDELAQWFVAPVEWKPELGESWEAMGQRGEITELEPPRVLEWNWGPEMYRFEIEADDDGCRLTFTHVFEDRTVGAQHAAGWECYLLRLQVHLDGGFLSETEAHVIAPQLHEEYAEAFGLDPERGRRMLAGVSTPGLSLRDGIKLRFERRYDHPIERVWRAITEPSELAEWFPGQEELEITTSEEPELLVGRWYGENELRFELSEDADGCLLVFTHALPDRENSARDAAGWDSCFARFDALLAGEPLGDRESLEPWAERHERYAELFAVDPEVGRRAFAEHASQR